MQNDAAPEVTKIFIGPNGLRLGWRLFLFASNGVVFWFVLRGAIGILGLRTPGGHGLAGALLAQGSLVVALLAAAAVMAVIERSSLAEYGLPARSAFGARFWLGAAWGFAALTLLLLLIRLGHGFDFGDRALEGRSLVIYAVFWAVSMLVVSCFEEFLFRGYALYTLASGIGFWPAALLLSLLFGALHLRNPSETWMGGLNAALVGVFFCLTVRRTGSLWFAMGLHFMWNYAESFIYSVPDSGAVAPGHLLNSSLRGPHWLTGGAVGPEGSVLAVVVIATMFIVFDRLYRQVRFPLAASYEPSAATVEPTDQ